MVAHIHYDHDRLAALCEKWRITELALFGSVLRDDFRPDSNVDVLTRSSVEQSRNPYRKQLILENAETVYTRHESAAPANDDAGSADQQSTISNQP